MIFRSYLFARISLKRQNTKCTVILFFFFFEILPIWINNYVHFLLTIGFDLFGFHFHLISTFSGTKYSTYLSKGTDHQKLLLDDERYVLFNVKISVYCITATQYIYWKTLNSNPPASRNGPSADQLSSAIHNSVQQTHYIYTHLNKTKLLYIAFRCFRAKSNTDFTLTFIPRFPVCFSI